MGNKKRKRRKKEKSSQITRPSKMNAPKLLNITKQSIDVYFDPPNKDGFALIDCYKIQIKMEDNQWEIGYEGMPKDYILTFDDLMPGTIYHFRVRCKNAMISSYSKWSKVTKIRTDEDPIYDSSYDSNNEEDDEKQKMNQRKSDNTKVDELISMLNRAEYERDAFKNESQLTMEKYEELRMRMSHYMVQKEDRNHKKIEWIEYYAMQSEIETKSKLLKKTKTAKNDLSAKCTLLIDKLEKKTTQYESLKTEYNELKKKRDTRSAENEIKALKKKYENTIELEMKYQKQEFVAKEMNKKYEKIQNRHNALIDKQKESESKYKELDSVYNEETKSKNEIASKYKALQIKFQSMVKETNKIKANYK